MPLIPENIVACLDCDLLQRVSSLPEGATARCRRCGHTIAYNKPDSLNRTLALAMAAAIALIVANIYPLMGLSISGRQTSTTIMGGAREMWLQGQELGAMIVLFCTAIAPAVHIGIMLTILTATKRAPAPQWVGTLLRWSNWHQPWAMVEVMMLGLLVALIKIAELATVTPGIGMFAAGALVAFVTAMTVSFDPREVWKRVEWFHREKNEGMTSDQSTSDQQSLAHIGPITGKKLGLIVCECCGLLSKPVDIHEPGKCPRCGEELALRRHDAIQRTWALIMAAAICYIPANVFPVMVSKLLVGVPEDDTIISGVVLLYKTGSWHLALIVLIASVVIPLAKIAALAYLLISVQRGSIQGQQERLRLYRLVEFVGRWSMLDVFVVAFTVALIQLQPLMSIKPGAGVLFFAAVVILTMIAAENFDPRLIWDSHNEQGGQHD
jgi:paraquat-inducible protein A